MRTLVDNLVLLAKLEGEDLRPAEPFELGALVDGDRRGAARTRRRVASRSTRASTATVIGDRAELHEALANIVDNAIKYAPGSPIRIAIDAAGDGGVAVAIADEGPGIAAEDREAIFERFYRGHTRGDVEGSGLGLAIAKRAVERAGGTLRLDPDGRARDAFRHSCCAPTVWRARLARPSARRGLRARFPRARPSSTISRIRGWSRSWRSSQRSNGGTGVAGRKSQ